MESTENIDLIEVKKNELFKKDILDLKILSEKITKMYEDEFKEAFKQILLLSKEDFMSFIINGIRILLIEMYGEENLNDDNLIKIQEKSFNKIEKEYQMNYRKLNYAWNNYIREKNKNKENINYLTNFRKHCCETNDIAYHNCQIEQSKFLSVEENNEIKYVICIECQTVYYSNFILCYCSYCNIDYYSSILSKEENKNLLIATWANYHCEKIINEKMKCIKCRKDFYLNLETKMLNCLNPKCNFITKSNRILWTCTICKEDFKSEAIVYNPLQYKRVKQVIAQTLNIKHRAHPKRIPCCKLNIFFTEFTHKKDCDGILYEGELDNKIIIVCEKCKAINFYDRFIWTCPQCNNRFRDKLLLKKKKTFSHLYSNLGKKNNLTSLNSERNSYDYNSNYFNRSESRKNSNCSICETESSAHDNFKKSKTNLYDILEKRRNDSKNHSERDSVEQSISERKDLKMIFKNGEEIIENYNKNKNENEEDNSISKKLFIDEIKNDIDGHNRFNNRHKKSIDYNSSDIKFDGIFRKNFIRNDERKRTEYNNIISLRLDHKDDEKIVVDEDLKEKRKDEEKLEENSNEKSEGKYRKFIRFEKRRKEEEDEKRKKEEDEKRRRR